jgi:hypothetical protein
LPRYCSLIFPGCSQAETFAFVLFVFLALYIVLPLALPPRKAPGESTPPDAIATPGATTPSPHALDLLKLEYQKAAERYENIYRAIWQNFSFMAILAAGILTFASKQFRLELTALLSLLPLLFWYVATYLPLNYYGEQTRDALYLIEGDINRLFLNNTNDPQFMHFRRFGTETFRWRVAHAVNLTSIAVVVASAWLLSSLVSAEGRHIPLLRSDAASAQER